MGRAPPMGGALSPLSSLAGGLGRRLAGTSETMRSPRVIGHDLSRSASRHQQVPAAIEARYT